MFAFKMQEFMLLLTPIIYKMHPFTPKVDEIVDLLDKSNASLDYKSSGIKILPYEKFQKMNKDEFKVWSKVQDEYEFEGLKSLYEKQNSEIKNCMAEIRKKYIDNLNCNELKDFKVSLQDLNYHLGYDILKLKRLGLVRSPKFTHTIGQHSRTKIKYDMVKIYWFDDHAELKRELNKNVGSLHLEMEDIVAKVFALDGYETMLEYPSKENGIKVDMLLTKDGKKWIVEVKQKNRDELIKTFVSMELWKLYKSTYEID